MYVLRHYEHIRNNKAVDFEIHTSSTRIDIEK
jgi:hypothetical protein